MITEAEPTKLNILDEVTITSDCFVIRLKLQLLRITNIHNKQRSLPLLCHFTLPGGMGTAYSLPRSPEDYLSNVDEMDIPETGKSTSKSIASITAQPLCFKRK